MAFFGFLAGADFAAAEIPYQECSWKTREYTERLVRNSAPDTAALTEAGYCLDCLSAASENPGQPAFLSRLSDISDMDLPPECFFASSARSIEKEPSKHKKSGKYNYYHCMNPEDGWTMLQPAIDPSGKTRLIYPRAPCLNEDYAKMTFKAFHAMARCFGFSPKERKRIFALFNHESKFILNQKSGTGARCYGQLTASAMTEISKRIYLSGNPEPHWRSRIYNEALRRCPNLEERAMLPDSIKPDRKTGRKDNGRFEDKIDSPRAVTCRLTQHAPACFFYAMYNIRINLRQIDKTIESSLGERIRQSMPLPKELKDLFKTPMLPNETVTVKAKFTDETEETWEVRDIYHLRRLLYNSKGKKRKNYRAENLKIIKKRAAEGSFPDHLKKHWESRVPLNQILAVKGHFMENGKRVHKKWIARDARQLYELLYDPKTGKKRREYRPEDLKIERQTLYDIDENAKWALSYQAYNGGPQIIRSKLRSFIEDRKKAAAAGDFCDNGKNRDSDECSKKSMKKLRERLSEGKPASFDMPAFQETLPTDEVKSFLSQIKKHADYLNNEGKSPSNPLEAHLIRIAGGGVSYQDALKKTSPEKKQEIKSFIESIKGKCFDKDLLLDL